MQEVHIHADMTSVRVSALVRAETAVRASEQARRRPARGSRRSAAEIEGLLGWRESCLEVESVDVEAVLAEPAVEGIVRGGHAGKCSLQVVGLEVHDGDVAV